MVPDFKEMFPVPAYLDNNMIIDIENGKISMSEIDKIVGSKNIVYGYSDAHIYETDTRQAHNGFTKEQLVTQRLNTISTVTKDIFFNRVDGHLQFSPFSPFKRYDILKPQFPNKAMIVQGFINNMSFENRQKWREKFSFDSGDVNNQAPENVIKYIADKLAEKGENMGNEFKEFNRLCNTTKDTKLYHTAVFFAIKLEMAGYSKEKKKSPEHNPDFPSMWDLDHITNAAYCEYFISKDRRCCDKAEVIYRTMRIPTSVIKYTPEQN